MLLIYSFFIFTFFENQKFSFFLKQKYFYFVFKKKNKLFSFSVFIYIFLIIDDARIQDSWIRLEPEIAYKSSEHHCSYAAGARDQLDRSNTWDCLVGAETWGYLVETWTPDCLNGVGTLYCTVAVGT